ncbi:e27278b1-fb0b-429f-89c8-375d281dcdbb [Thermothielavioides terrestris]|uniref:E27278b1-fb0b-429f-89c8-375d281dcdbb n=1 Tax=Thermothielavioides terrestris TaxID=2587410 RepID=A0A3S4BPX7_9PEZI|nr:e27278b1-fb0b-429f-89c8-375d281dcdbb [Thermothielavioides terrestris]
MVLDILDKN